MSKLLVAVASMKSSLFQSLLWLNINIYSQINALDTAESSQAFRKWLIQRYK